MSNGARVSLNTFLGNCLEELASTAVSSLPVAFERSPAPPKGLVSPDFIRVDSPAIFIAVTSTPTRNTFQKKKWRYVHEIFSNKQYYAPRPFAINVQLSPPGALQPNDEKIIDGFFDAEVRPPSAILVPAIERLKSEYEGADGNAKQALRALRKDANIAKLVVEITRRLRECLRAPIEKQMALWECVQRSSSRDVRREVGTVLVQAERTNLRAVCFGSVLIHRERLPAFLKGVAANRRLADDDVAQLTTTGVELTKGINGYKPPDFFMSTVRTYGDGLVAKTIERIAVSDEAQHVVQDLGDEAATLRNVADVMSLLRRSGSSQFVKRVREDFALAVDPKDPKRLTVLDYALLCGGVSSTEMDRILSTKYPDFSSFNRVQCMISAKCQGRNSYSGDEANKIAERIWLHLQRETDVVAVADEVALQRVLESRRSTLKLLGTETNPAQLIFEMLCTDAGLGFEIVSLSSCIGDVGVGGRVAKVERIYQLDTSPPRFIKVLSGYKGGYEHKAEELAARGWILRYRRSGAAWKRSEIRLGFVHEGDWDESYLDLMLRSGWDWQSPLESVVKAATTSRAELLKRLGG
jgi:hypothetical protein